jgi:hypothetical protein
MTPNPVALARLADPAAPSCRSLFCALYDDCLEVAERSRWNSWSCEQCELFARRRAMHRAETSRRAESRDAAVEG